MAAVFTIGIFSGSIISKYFKATEDEDPAMQETTIVMDIIDIQITVLHGHISYIVIYASDDPIDKNGSIYAVYPKEDTVIMDAQGNQADCFSLTVGQSIRVRALNVVSYTGWLNRATGESFPAEGLRNCYEITIMD